MNSTYSQNRRRRFAIGDRLFSFSLLGSSHLMVVLLVAIFITLVAASWLSIRTFGFQFITSVEWNPVNREFGALAFIAGTLLSSFLALAISVPFSIAIALYLGEYFKGGFISSFLRSMVELMAGIPSVVYGLWGLFFLVPLVRTMEMAMGVPPYGVGVLSASLILAIMIIPYSASVAREVISMVPTPLKDAAYSLGLTRFEVIMKVVLPYARSGIFAGILLSFGRAIGETMAVTMLIGNRNRMPTGIFSPANTMASIIANEFTEATEDIYLSSLMEIALLLFVISTVINIVGRVTINRLGHE